ncbi:class I SAM-dependent methyltransferase [soil metagenome]
MEGNSYLPRTAGQLAFGTDAAGYHDGRIGYPDELFDAIFARTVRRPRILEIGAGTGLATRSLLARAPADVVVVESDPALVRYLKDNFDDPNLTIINSSFPDAQVTGTFDLIVCAAAFHWLDPQAALARVRDLLAPDGVWAMWWNAYRNPGHGDRLAQAITPMLAGVALPPSEGPHGHYSLDVDLHTDTLHRAGFYGVQPLLFRRERTLDAAAVRALYESYSYVRALPDPQRKKLLDDITQVVTDEFGGMAPNIVLTAAYSAVAVERPR